MSTLSVSAKSPALLPASPINLNRFDLGTLRLYLLTLETGSLTAGADRFGISLAAASKRIAELEAHVGTTLLLRSKKGVSPTAAGQTLQRHAVELVSRLEQMAMAMSDFQRGSHGHLRLWANTSAFGHFLPKVLSQYVALHPDIRIDLEDVLSEDAAKAVAAGMAELAVIGDNTPIEGLQTMVCEVDDLVLVLPPAHPLAEQGAVEFMEALDYDLVGMSRSTSLMRQISTMAAAQGLSIRIRVQVRSFDAMCKMVRAGVGIGILPRSSALPHAPALGLKLMQLDGMWTQRRLLLAMRDRAALSEPARAFVELVEQMR